MIGIIRSMREAETLTGGRSPRVLTLKRWSGRRLVGDVEYDLVRWPRGMDLWWSVDGERWRLDVPAEATMRWAKRGWCQLDPSTWCRRYVRTMHPWARTADERAVVAEWLLGMKWFDGEAEQ